MNANWTCEDCEIDWNAYIECPTKWYYCPNCSGKLERGG